jgi:hypothetical protein
MDSLLKEGDIELFSNPLELKKNNDTDYYQSILCITNKSNHYIIFKIYINQKPSLYNVNPSTSFLKPNNQINIQVRKYDKEEKDENTKDKFLIRFFAVNRVVESNEDAKFMIKNKSYNEEDKYDEIINIIINKGDNLIDNLNQENLDESKLKDIEFDTDQAIPTYQNLNNNLKNQINNIERAIENFENQLQNIRINKDLINQKDNSLKKNENDKKRNNGLNKTLTLLFLLISFVLGAYFAKMINKFSQAKNKIK